MRVLISMMVGGLVAAGATLLAAPPEPPAADPVATVCGEPRLDFGRVTLASGVRLHYAVQGDPDGPVLVLLHGYSDSWQSYSRVLPLLPARYRVYAPDLRGHGDSDRTLSEYSLGSMTRDVIEFMDALGVDRATVAGHSMGSYVAQQVALTAPRRVDRLLLIASTTTPRTIVGIEELVAAVSELSDPVSVDFIRDLQESTVFAPVPAEFMDEVVRQSAKLPTAVWQSAAASLLAIGPAPDLGRHRIPTLLLWGEHDALMLRYEQDALVETLDARLIVYPETGHAPHWERPVETARDLIAFMER